MSVFYDSQGIAISILLACQLCCLYGSSFKVYLIQIIFIIIKLFKGIHKRHVPVQGDTLTYNLYSYKNTIIKTEQHTQYKHRIKQLH